MLCGFAIRITLLASFFFFCSGVGDYPYLASSVDEENE